MIRSHSRLVGSKAGTSHDVVRVLRTNILNGRWQPGTQLPPRLALLRSLKTTPVTLHHAVQRLVNDGFLRTAAGSGTFVAELPPHLNTYAVVFIYDPANWIDKQNWSRYYQALTQAAIRLQQETGKRLLMFHGIDHHADSEERMRLITHIERQRLAGLIFTNHPFTFEGTPILDAPGLPRVAMMDPDTKFPHVSAVNFDGAMWVTKALDHLAAEGRRRVAMIDFGMGPDFSARVQAGLAARGMVSHRRWHQFVSLRNAEGAANAVEMLMNDRERPDALLVEDDNFVEQAVAGLVAAGVSVPACGEPCRTEEVAVVGHANFPVAPAKLLPMRLLGYDANLFMRTSVDLIDRQRQGEKVPHETTLPALWEEEVSGQWAASSAKATAAMVGSGQSGLVTARAPSDSSKAESRSGIPARLGQAGMPDLLSNKKSVFSAGKRKMELAVS